MATRVPNDEWLVNLSLCGILACLANCTAGATTDPESADGVGGGDSSSSSFGSTGGAAIGAAGAGGNGSDGCSDDLRLIYVIDDEKNLYRFNPTILSTAAFELIGTMDCPEELPYSMSVSRQGAAYVLYGEYSAWAPGQFECSGLYEIDLDTAACQSVTPFTCGTAGFDMFGMGYATDGPSQIQETLYIGNTLESGLASLDVHNGTITPRGNLPAGAEFTGNAKGELWGFFPQADPPEVMHVDKDDGSELVTIKLTALPSIYEGDWAAWAFAYWGGSFYVFYRVEPLHSATKIYKLEYDGTLSLHLANTGITIVGAGVSTCAPVHPPK